MIRFLLLLLLSPLLAGPMLAAGPRNIVLIMADDIGIEGFGCYGGESYQTPHIDRLASEGLRFTHAYSQPLCTPTRLEIMTGLENHRNWQAFGILPRGARTFGHLMQSRGYKTAIAGKWQLQSYDPPEFPGAAKRRGIGMHPNEAGFDGYALFHALHTEDKGSRYANPTFLQDGVLRETLDGQYGEDLWVEYLLEFMEEHREERQFIYYPMALPHWPMVPTPLSKAWSDPERRLEESTDHFPDMVRYMDVLVGRLVEGIAKIGLAEDTLVLFYSDNGTDRRITSRIRGQDVKGGKNTTRQTGIRVPLIAYWPGTIEAGTCGDLVEASDFFPTLAELADHTLPEHWPTDGVSFAPQLMGKQGNPREWAYFWYDPRPGWDKQNFKRHVFALDHRYKLFRDGRFLDIAGEGVREERLDNDALTAEAQAAREKLMTAIATMARGPHADAAQGEVDAYGDPIKE